MAEIHRESNPKQTTTFANATALNTLSGSYVVKSQNTNRNFLYDSTDYEHKPDPQADPIVGEILFVDEDSVFDGAVDGFFTDVATNSIWEFKEVDNNKLVYKLKSVFGGESPKAVDGVIIGNSNFADIKLEDNSFSVEDLNNWLSQYSNLFFLKGSYTIISSTIGTNYITGGNIYSYNNDVVNFHCEDFDENIYFKGYCDISNIHFGNKVVIDYVIEPGVINFRKCHLNDFQINSIVDPDEGEENLLMIACYDCLIKHIYVNGFCESFDTLFFGSGSTIYAEGVDDTIAHSDLTECSIYSDGQNLSYCTCADCVFYSAYERYDESNSLLRCHRIAYSVIEDRENIDI